MSRQFQRQLDRRAAKDARSEGKKVARKEAARELLIRQSEREKADFYGRPVAASIAPSRSRITKRQVRKAEPFGRHLKNRELVLFEGTPIQRTLVFHATKSWRAA